MTLSAILTEEQEAQIRRQIESHRKCKEPTVIDPIVLDAGVTLTDLVVHPGVLRPMSSQRLASYLYQIRSSIRGKTVIDIGSGSGIQGLTAAIAGASRVILSDITSEAYGNTVENIDRLNLSSVCEARQGDLFEAVDESADIVIFAQPYFPGRPTEQDPFTFGMLDDGGLIHRFLEQVKHHCAGSIFMCHLDLAGDLNNPLPRGEEHGFEVQENLDEFLDSGDQKGLFHVYELTCLERNCGRQN